MGTGEQHLVAHPVPDLVEFAYSEWRGVGGEVNFKQVKV